MSRFDLRDVSERLTKSRTVESVISEFLRSLETMRQGWRASLAFYEVSQDALVDVYELDQSRLVRRNIVVAVDRLPHRLVREIFQSTTLPTQKDRVAVSGASTHYVANRRDASELMPLTVLAEWESCICLPLSYQDDLIAMLVLVSPKKNAFAGKALAEVMPLKSIATVALAQHLYRTTRQRPAEPAAAPPPPPKPAPPAPPPLRRAPAAMPPLRRAPPAMPPPGQAAGPPRLDSAPSTGPPRLKPRLEPEPPAEPPQLPPAHAAAPLRRRDDDVKPQSEVNFLDAPSEQLDQDDQERVAEIESLVEQIETLDRNSSEYKEELERVKSAVSAMEQDSEAAVEYLTEAYSRLQTTQWTLGELERTVAALKDVFEVLAGEVDVDMLPEIIVEWFCTRLEIARCSLLVPDASGETLMIGAHRGVDPGVAGRVRVRVGQGVAGWVAAHRKPLFVRVREDAQVIPRSGDGTYNSDSFIVVPLAHNGRLHGVINLSNRLDGESFVEADLDRVLLVASAFAAMLGGQQVARRAAAWA